ncbi:(d)CMP kinase [Oceanidesulfovibrio indonesiensis]|uniref:Cytidylate kinase n=1 Tax=Oceanidesulfovibrio indonesiensis TaxID=54767 RepID=A0A7M3MBD3_9BACT|nr:(d)CMP kinase [Oceanidesulfovibrio indonesiensis]TVM15396.1 (d)CMP kinase [Oceanidesulfovibrio indonesiensis]
MADHFREIVTLDGPAGVGKTTMAKRLAGALGIPYLDTGAMYRVCGMRLGEEGATMPESAIMEVLRSIDFALEGSGAETKLLVDMHPVGAEIRTERVGMLASTVGTLAPVRAYCREAQQGLGRLTPLVAEGRDMGTVVFPDAAHKFFLDAEPEIRARRRLNQLKEMGTSDLPTLEDLAAQIAARDHQDRTRSEAPLKPAEDAVIIDTGELDVDGVFERLLQAIKAKS